MRPHFLYVPDICWNRSHEVMVIAQSYCDETLSKSMEWTLNGKSLLIWFIYSHQNRENGREIFFGTATKSKCTIFAKIRLLSAKWLQTWHFVPMLISDFSGLNLSFFTPQFLCMRKWNYIQWMNECPRFRTRGVTQRIKCQGSEN